VADDAVAGTSRAAQLGQAVAQVTQAVRRLLANPSATSSFIPLPYPLCRVHPRHLADPGRSAGQASGCPSLIHRLTNHAGLHVRGFNEEGTTTTPFDMVMRNDLDRFHLVMDVIDRVPGLAQRGVALRQHMADERLRHRAWTRQVGDDAPDVRDWVWPGAPPPAEAATDTQRGQPA
jgi:hypothetical protein